MVDLRAKICCVWLFYNLQSASMCHQCLIGGVLYAILGFVGNYDLEKCVLLLLFCFFNFVVLTKKADYYVGGITVVVP